MKRILTIIGLFLFISGYSQQSDKIEYLRVDSLLYSGSLSNPDTLIVPHPDSTNQYKFMNMADPVEDRDGVPLGYFNDKAVVIPVITLPFDTTYSPTGNELKGEIFWDEANNAFSYRTGLGSTSQITRESLIKVYNNNGVAIPNGAVLATVGVMPDGTLEVVRAIATNRYDALLWATTDIPVGEYGDAIVVYGSIRDVPTTGLLTVGQVWLSDIDSGEVVKTKPSFPSYEYSLGAVTKIGALDGQYEARLDGIDPYSTTRNVHNGQFRETIAATVASDGATITLSLERSGGGDLTQMWSSGLRDLDCTPAKTIALTAGTDIAPQPNYVYILESNPDVLVVSTSGFPKNVEYEHVFDGVLFSASRTQTDDALANRNWNDHIQDTVGQGHLVHIAERIRQDNAQYNSGMAATMTIGGGTTIDISQVAGDSYQLHLQNVDAMNTATGSYMYVQNDFVTAWDRITDIESITTDANGNALLNTSYSLVTYSVANKSGETDQYVLTVPTGTYSKNVPQNAEDDLANYAVYDFPSYLKGKALLVAKFNIVNNNGTISLYSTQDLRGKVPNAAIGGGGGSTGAADFLSLLDTYSSYSGLAYTGLKVGLGEAGLIATQWTEDASGNLDINGYIENQLTGVVEFNNDIRVLADVFSSLPLTGKGVSMLYNSVQDEGFILSYDGDLTEYKPLIMQGGNIVLDTDGGVDEFVLSGDSVILSGNVVDTFGRVIVTNSGLDRQNNIEYYPYPIYVDDFSASNNEWVKLGDYVDNTFSVSGGTTTLSAPTNFYTSAWGNRNAYGRNSIISFDIIPNNNSAGIHLREQDVDNFILCYINSTGNVRVAKYVGGVLTDFNSDLLPDWSAATEYRIVAKIFENHITFLVLDSDGGVLFTSDISSSDIVEFQATSNGMGCGSVSQTYNNYYGKKITSFTNIVSLGDSNTGGSSNPLHNPGNAALYPEMIQKHFINDNITCINAGISGDKTTDVIARLDTDLADRKVNEARNVATLQIGVNDFSGGASVSTTFDNFKTLVNDINDLGFELWVCTVPPWDGLGGDIREYNELIKKSSDSLNYQVIDLYSDLADELDSLAAEYHWGDGDQHLNAAGHELVANKLIGLTSLPLTNSEFDKNRVQTLTGTTPTLDVSSGANATIALTGNTTLTITNLTAGTEGTIELTNGATPYTFTISGATLTGNNAAIDPTPSSVTTVVYWKTSSTTRYGFIYDN